MPKNRILPILSVALALPLLGWAQVPAPTPPITTAAAPVPPTAAERLIEAAIKKLQQLKTVSAEILLKAEMLGQNFSLQGEYLKAPANRVKLLLSLQGLGDTSGTMLQICDGTTLWDFTKILTSENYEKKVITPILKALDKPECDAEFRDQVISRLGFSGPDALLAGLVKAAAFDQMEAGTLADGKKVWILRGRWKDNASLSGVGQPMIAPDGPLPSYVPSLVTLWIGQDDGWPYQLQLEGKLPSLLEKRDERKIGPDGRPMGRKSTAINREKPTKILIVYSNVKLDQELGPENFAFQPPEQARVNDLTAKITTELEQAIADRAAQKKNDAAKSGSVLDQPVTAPRPSPDTPSKPAIPDRLGPAAPPK